MRGAPVLMLVLVLVFLLLARAAAAQPFVTTGTAFFVAAEGIAVTAAHVAQGCTRLQVASPLLPAVAAGVVALDARTDLALLRAAGPGTGPGAAPGIIGLGAPAGLSVGAAMRGLRVLGYGAAAQAPLQESQPRVLTARVRVRSADPRFRIWLQDDRIAHGWSGGPILVNGRLAGVLLELLPDPAETARVLGRAEGGVAAGTDAAAVAALLARAGARAGPAFGPPGDAVVRVFCWR